MDELKSLAKEILKEIVVVEAKIIAGAMSRVGNSIDEKQMIEVADSRWIKSDGYEFIIADEDSRTYHQLE